MSKPIPIPSIRPTRLYRRRDPLIEDEQDASADVIDPSGNAAAGQG
ncbi:hypothetical protein [Microbacterium caowuchunii]|nr:hypothetical protein [Microbacterium caowuchunii]